MELPLNGNNREHAHLIVDACNHHKELISMVEASLNMVKAEVVTDVINKIASIERRLKEIKKDEDTNSLFNGRD